MTIGALLASGKGQVGAQLWLGTVTAVASVNNAGGIAILSGTCTVQIDGADTTITATNGETYVNVNDRVLLTKIGKQLYVLQNLTSPAEQSGVIAVSPTTPSGSNFTGSTAVVFSPAFLAPPAITFGLSTGVPGTQVLGVGYTSLTASGMTVVLTRTNTNTTGVAWSARPLTQ